MLFDHGHARIATLGHARIDGDLAEEGHPRIASESLAAAVAEDLVALAVFADEVAHVLDNAEHRHAHLPEHLQPLPGIDETYFLWGGDDDGPGERHGLGQRELG